MKMDAFKTVQNVNIHLGYFGMKICHQEFNEIVKSGHTVGSCHIFGILLIFTKDVLLLGGTYVF